MFHFTETNIREQEMYEMRTQTSVDNTVNDLRHKMKFENCVKTKITFLLSETLLFFLMPRQKPEMLDWQNLLIESLKMM